MMRQHRPIAADSVIDPLVNFFLDPSNGAVAELDSARKLALQFFSIDRRVRKSRLSLYFGTTNERRNWR
jgi:hypothetical protein